MIYEKIVFITVHSDVICETMQEKKFNVNLESFDGKMKHLRMSEYNVYTDGSRIDGQCGAGYSIYKYKTNIASNCANLPTTSTVFQAEIIGIKLACEELTKMQGEINIKYVKIFSDSQAAVAALDSSEITSQAVKDAKNALNKLASTTKHTVLVWIKAHVGHVGNEAADELAKQGTVSEKSVKIGILFYIAR